MGDKQAWIGCGFSVKPDGNCWSANHRIRAAKYLLAMGIHIEIPTPSVSETNPGEHDDPATLAALIRALPSNYDADGNRIPITDSETENSAPFPEHTQKFLDWPDHLWIDRPRGRPCEDRGKNAYHLRYLAEAMLKAGEWLGNTPTLHLGKFQCKDGSHRIRAAKYLLAKGHYY
jgi:hypothetical protein